MDRSIAVAEEAVQRLVATPQDRELYRLRQKYERDKRSSEAYIDQRARKEERERLEKEFQVERELMEQGLRAERERLEQGLRAERLQAENEKRKMVEVMLGAQMDIEIIVQSSGWTKEQILQLQEKN